MLRTLYKLGYFCLLGSLLLLDSLIINAGFGGSASLGSLQNKSSIYLKLRMAVFVSLPLLLVSFRGGIYRTKPTSSSGRDSEFKVAGRRSSPLGQRDAESIIFYTLYLMRKSLSLKKGHLLEMTGIGLVDSY